jgi:uroporphyrinogen decarboxylase
MLTPKDNFLRAVRRQSPEWVPYGMESVVTIRCPVVERPSTAGKDDFGVSWSFEKASEGGTYPTVGDYVITDIENWRDQARFPDVNSKDWDSVTEQVKGIDREENLVQGFCEMGLFERTYLLMGMEEALMAFYTHPDELYELCGAIADYKIELLRRYYAASKMDILWYGDDWGTQSNLFISPELWRGIIKPHTKRIYDSLKELGVIINQHSCGKIESVFQDMCEMGADMWNPCQPCNDLRMLKERYGDRICFAGGVDSQFVLANPQMAPEDVKNEVMRRINEMALPSGGYIIAPSHSVPYDKAKLSAMETTARQYGREIYCGKVNDNLNR